MFPISTADQGLPGSAAGIALISGFPLLNAVLNTVGS